MTSGTPSHNLTRVHPRSGSLKRFSGVLDPSDYDALRRAMQQGRKLFEGRKFWHFNSTAQGGGVAEMLQSQVSYLSQAGIDCRWAVIEGVPEFFRVTKRIHNNLHGEMGDGGDLGAQEHGIYESVLKANAEHLGSIVADGDFVMLHDPQTAGLVRPLKKLGAQVAWRCHVGLDTPNHFALRAWDFLRKYVLPADAFVFSRELFAWEGLPDEKLWVIAPSIDAFSAKNQELDASAVTAILSAAGLMDASANGPARFMRGEGAEGLVERRARFLNEGPPFRADVKLVVQVSRWDRLKDPWGVIEGYARYIAGRTDAELVLAGPEFAGVADDPDSAQVAADARTLWEELPEDLARRVHLAVLPMDDIEENAAIVNALQRRADVIVQKSLAEGFGLTVAEAMWKGRPVVASRIGGIQDQIIDGETGILITNPSDLPSFGHAVVGLLDDPSLARRMGEAGRERVRRTYLDPRQLVEYLQLASALR